MAKRENQIFQKGDLSYGLVGVGIIGRPQENPWSRQSHLRLTNGLCIPWISVGPCPLPSAA